MKILEAAERAEGGLCTPSHCLKCHAISRNNSPNFLHGRLSSNSLAYLTHLTRFVYRFVYSSLKSEFWSDTLLDADTRRNTPNFYANLPSRAPRRISHYIRSYSSLIKISRSLPAHPLSPLTIHNPSQRRPSTSSLLPSERRSYQKGKATR